MTHLTKKQTDQLKEQLMGRRRELMREIREALSQSQDQRHQDLAGMVGDAGDDSIANMLVDLDAAIADRHVQEAREIQAALDRMKDDSYGECIDCGGEIPFARLEAMPTAQRCVRCQEKREKVYAGAPSPRL